MDEGTGKEVKKVSRAEKTEKVDSKVSVEVPVAKGPSLTQKMRQNPWIISTLIFGIVALILLVGTLSGGATGAVGAVPKADVEAKIMNFVQSQVGEGATLVGTEVKNGLYEITISYNGQQVPIYMTLDGQNLVQGVAPFDLVLQQTEQQNTNEPIEVSEGNGAVKGNANAAVTIVEFSDFECPYCEKFYSETYPSLLKDYINTGKVKLVFRHFPLSFHPDAQKASEAAACARVQGGDVAFFSMHDKLFSNQQALDVTNLKKYAQELGLNTAKFNTCLDSGATEAEVNADLLEGQSYGVTGTPAFFVNGVLIEGAQPYSVFKQTIDAELAKVSA